MVLGGSPLGTGELEVRGRHQQAVLLAGTDGTHDDALGVSGEVVQPMLWALLAALVLGVVLGPLPEREHRPPGLGHDLLAELDGLGEYDLFLSIEQGNLADLLEVHADGVVDADHVLGHRLQLGLGRGLVVVVILELRRRVLPGLLLALLDGDLYAQLGCSPEVARCADDVLLPPAGRYRRPCLACRAQGRMRRAACRLRQFPWVTST